MSRINNIIIIVGKRGTGKTDFTKELVRASRMPKKLIIDIFDNPVWRNMKTHNRPDDENVLIPAMDLEDIPFHKQGLYRAFSDDTDALEMAIDQHCINSLIVVEDASRYFSLQLNKRQKRYLLNSKQKNLDIVLVFHYLSTLPTELLKMADYLTIFKTGEKFYDEKKYFFPDFKEAFEEVFESKNKYENITIKLN